MPVYNTVFMQEPESEPFKKPVNPIDLGIPVRTLTINIISSFLPPPLSLSQDYFDIIKNPIDLSIIRRKLEDGEYSNPWEVSVSPLCNCGDRTPPPLVL